jgi:hypothetical protein
MAGLTRPEFRNQPVSVALISNCKSQISDFELWRAFDFVQERILNSGLVRGVVGVG